MRPSNLVFILSIIIQTNVLAQKYQFDTICAKGSNFNYNKSNGSLESCGCFDLGGNKIGKWLYFDSIDGTINIKYKNVEFKDSLSVLISANREITRETYYANGKPRITIQRQNSIIVSILERTSDNVNRLTSFYYPGGGIKSIQYYIPNIHFDQNCEYSIEFGEESQVNKYRIFE